MSENIYNRYLIEKFGISPRTIEIIDRAEASLAEEFAALDDITAINQLKVLSAFQDNHINATHFDWSTGYGLSRVKSLSTRQDVHTTHLRQ